METLSVYAVWEAHSPVVYHHLARGVSMLYPTCVCVCVCSYAFPIHIYCQKPLEALMEIQLIIYSTREKGSNLPSFVVEAPLAWYRASSAGCGVDWFVLLACVQLFSFEERACRLLLDDWKVVYHCWEPETRLFVLLWVIAWWQHLEHSA